MIYSITNNAMLQQELFPHSYNNKTKIYDIYHDESKEPGYWHGFLFVPRSTRKKLLNLLNKARQNTNYNHKLHYVTLKNNTSWQSTKAKAIYAWTTIGIAALQQQKYNKYPPCICAGNNAFGRTQYDQYDILDNLLHCKFAIFKEKDKHKKMFKGMNKIECAETTFRMGLKGATHYMFNQNDPIKIGNVYKDEEGGNISKFGRDFGIKRTLRRFKYEKREYVSFIKKPKIIPQNSDHTSLSNNYNKEDSHLLQLTDILLGGFRFFATNSKSNSIRYKVSKPCNILLTKDRNNFIRMMNSRYKNGFSLKEAWLNNSKWQFKNLEKNIIKLPGEQLKLNHD